jgi:hypothetical protein
LVLRLALALISAVSDTVYNKAPRVSSKYQMISVVNLAPY